MKTGKVIEILNQARENGVHLFLDDNNLRLKVQKEKPVNPEFLAILKLHKEEITEFLNRESRDFIEIHDETQTIKQYNRNQVSQIPLSFSQERLWFIDKLKGSDNYHISLVMDIQGLLDKTILEKSFIEIITRHEVLRTVFIEEDGIPYQEVKAKETWNLQYTEQPMSGGEQEEFIEREINRSFDLSRDFMLRANLIKASDQKYLLVVVIHHIASDGWSMPIFINELIELYTSFKANRFPKLPALPVQYIDYALWQREYMSEEALERKMYYWKEKLNGLEPLDLPADFPRPAMQAFDGNEVDAGIDKDLTFRLQSLSQKEGVTIFMTLLAAFKVLLHRYTGQADVCVGVPIANRTQKETMPLIGFFLNLLTLRTDLGNHPSFIKVLADVKETTLTAYNYQGVPFEKIVDRVMKNRDMSRSPLFQVMFVLQNNEKAQIVEVEDITLSMHPFKNKTSKFDITFILAEDEKGINISVEYCTALFRQETIERMLMHYKILLSSIVLDPHETIDKLKMLTPAEEQELLFDFNDTVLDYPKNATIINLFEDQVREHPDRIAVVFDERELTYKELNEKANQLAAYLRERYAIQTEYLVGIKVARSEWMIIAMLGVLKAGSAYVPIDPEYPKERINYIIEDSRCRLVIDDEEIDKFRKEAGNWNKENPLLLSKPGNTAYVIYTSGSTGQPKGVMIEHKNVFAFITWCKLEFQHSDFDVVFGTTSICFDLSVFEIFFTICSGKKLRVLINALFIGNYLHTSGNILLNTVPGVIGALLNEKADLSHVTVLNMAGESIPVKFLNELDGDKIEIRNLYGPSESTTYSTFYRIKKGSQGLIGRPVANTKIYIVNESQNLQPVGVIGEICISGDGLARGYLGKEALTSEKFVLNPFDKGGRLYKTGDLGRWLPGGTIDFIGRKDDQVKIRGYRIEPGEIECRLQSYQGIEQAVVVTKCNEENEKELIAYIVSRQELDLTGIRMHLADALPVYMMPNQFIRMEQLPLTTSGKIDKKKLAGLENGNIESTVAYSAPQDEAEEKLVQIWEEILKKKKIGVNDNFFELGGHSLLAARVMARINKIFFIQLPISVLFKHSTIRLLAERISSNVQKPEESILVPINVNGTKRPVFCAPPAGGNVLVYYELSRSLGEDQPLYAFQAHGVDLVSAPLRSVYEMADAYIREMQKIDTTGPYTLLGYSFGGSVIYEMAIQLLKKGFEVSQLIIFDSLSPDKTLKNYKEMLPENYTNWLLYFTDIYNLSIGNNEQKITLTNDDLLNKVPGEQFQTFYNKISEKEKGITIEQLRAYTDVYIINASISYVPSTNIPINVPVIFFKADQVLTAFSNEQMEKRNEISEGRSRREDLGWRDFISNEVKIYNIPCNHLGMMNKANIDLMVQYLKPHLH